MSLERRTFLGLLASAAGALALPAGVAPPLLSADVFWPPVNTALMGIVRLLCADGTWFAFGPVPLTRTDDSANDRVHYAYPTCTWADVPAGSTIVGWDADFPLFRRPDGSWEWQKLGGAIRETPTNGAGLTLVTPRAWVQL